jgi:hypothetical protein
VQKSTANFANGGLGALSQGAELAGTDGTETWSPKPCSPPVGLMTEDTVLGMGVVTSIDTRRHGAAAAED